MGWWTRFLKEEAVHGAERAAEEAGERRVEQGLARGAERGAEETAEKAGAEAAEKGVTGKAARLAGVGLTLAWSMLSPLTDGLSETAKIVVAVVAVVFGLLMAFFSFTGIRAIFYRHVGEASAEHTEKKSIFDDTLKPSQSKQWLVGVGWVLVGGVVLAIIWMIWKISTALYKGADLQTALSQSFYPWSDIELQRDKLRKRKFLLGGLGLSTNDEECKNVSPASVDDCGAKRCALCVNEEDTINCGVNTGKCISCNDLYDLAHSADDDDDEESDKDKEFKDNIELYAGAGVGVYKFLLPKFFKEPIKKATKSAAKRVFMSLFKNMIKEQAARIAERTAASEAAHAAETAAVDAALAPALLTPIAPLALGLMAVADYAMMESMVADAIDVTSYRSYISNKSILDKRDKYDYPYIQSISENPEDVVPPNHHPAIYQLDLLINPLSKSQIPEADILYKLGWAFVEAQTAWISNVVSQDFFKSEILNNVNNSEMAAVYDNFVEIQHRGHISGYSGIERSGGDGGGRLGEVVDELLEELLELDGKLPRLSNGQLPTSSDAWGSEYCLYEIELYEAFDAFVNFDPRARDQYIYDYIKKYMEEYLSPGQVLNYIETGSGEGARLWTKPLDETSQTIIKRATFKQGEPKNTYMCSDLIKNYENGTSKLSGVSLTEAGCILLNQILDWESYIFPFRQEIKEIDQFITPTTAIDQLQKLSAHDLPKVAFSNKYRKIVSHNKLATVSTPDGEYLPLYYPSYSTTEMSCKYGWQAVKASGDLDHLASLGLDVLAKGSGVGVNIDGTNVVDPWLPFMYGVSYDEHIGVCKYDRQGGTEREFYCTRMGRDPSSLVNEGSGGMDYEVCNEEEISDIWTYTIGEEHYRDIDRWWNS